MDAFIQNWHVHVDKLKPLISYKNLKEHFYLNLYNVLPLKLRTYTNTHFCTSAKDRNRTIRQKLKDITEFVLNIIVMILKTNIIFLYMYNLFKST